MIECCRNLENNLYDFQNKEVYEYDEKDNAKNPLNDSFALYVANMKLEEIAELFLEKYYLEVLGVSTTN